MFSIPKFPQKYRLLDKTRNDMSFFVVELHKSHFVIRSAVLLSAVPEEAEALTVAWVAGLRARVS